MKYAVWFVRLIYAAWMIPAGLNHFVRLYPQPTGNQPLSIEVFTALLDSGLFTLVKAVELLAGVAVLTGFRLPLMLLAVLPVSFTVWYWDTELQGWWTASASYGWAVPTGGSVGRCSPAPGARSWCCPARRRRPHSRRRRSDDPPARRPAGAARRGDGGHRDSLFHAVPAAVRAGDELGRPDGAAADDRFRQERAARGGQVHQPRRRRAAAGQPRGAVRARRADAGQRLRAVHCVVHRGRPAGRGARRADS